MNKIILLLSICSLFLIAIFITQKVFRPHSHHKNINNPEAASAFEVFKQKYSRNYSPHEESYRYQIFLKKYLWVQAYNEKNTGVTVGINKFSDMTREEVKAKYYGYRRSEKKNVEYVEPDTSNLPDSVDWRDKGAVVDVKDQGQCGSCWAFSTVAGLEGVYQIGSGNLVSFSEQQIVDCSTENYGCEGGDLPPAYDYVLENGIEKESDYPYTAEDDDCQYDKSKVVFTPTSYKQVKPNNSLLMAGAVVNQPIPICIEADSDVFQGYTGGVITSKDCGTDLDHCVLLVGYNNQQGGNYWIVKNSWGTDWGEDGYVRIKKAITVGPGICGIAEEPVYPVWSQ